MKQFNLEEYRENPLRKVVTRDGRLAEIKSIDKSLLKVYLVFRF